MSSLSAFFRSAKGSSIISRICRSTAWTSGQSFSETGGAPAAGGAVALAPAPLSRGGAWCPPGGAAGARVACEAP
eukprot:CAMPEP_0179276016 /NCGR_PEP_ID=MMETSP0797-20121207/34360_1 /TAXON_ID=47934 /ORGANISM="Dinophysis acuminata, Strain DAEP01" /LENGTH=74 /DNA_ID=CAMNT_0020984559 /DNA_START=253 /DNA_END=474 /DNA_ORIENTATION=-